MVSWLLLQPTADAEQRLATLLPVFVDCLPGHWLPEVVLEGVERHTVGWPAGEGTPARQEAQYQRGFLLEIQPVESQVCTSREQETSDCLVYDWACGKGLFCFAFLSTRTFQNR